MTVGHLIEHLQCLPDGSEVRICRFSHLGFPATDSAVCASSSELNTVQTIVTGDLADGTTVYLTAEGGQT